MGTNEITHIRPIEMNRRQIHVRQTERLKSDSILRTSVAEEIIVSLTNWKAVYRYGLWGIRTV